ncbi:outer membrane protein [Legionella resiliens]|uniref:Outer membrane beta-barrel protein n=1 Tax=Legionella resiliens TaxID=2905958 RepID=A0ABS8X3I8_9GAMM|nr:MULTISPECIES: outer membrane beta-barrel protein [unclassified Legionella]MCE0722714.1 outer membrane beta-barrel protein [Legionella sp. 9fVS26]MCE3531867.1 outer membrane beta-barrel protein [Legionella sp. 8cVS16]
MHLRLKKVAIFCFSAAILPAYSGDMGPVTYKKKQGFYGVGLATYNAFDFNRAETASFFSPNAITPPAASIGDNWGYSLGVGYRFNPFFRTDFRVQGLPDIHFSVTDDGNETAHGRINTYTYMINGYLSYPLNQRVEPYLGGGVGAATSKTNTIFWPLAVQHEFGRTITRFAWQVGAGSLFRVTEHLDVDINYSYLTIGQTTNSGQYDTIASNGVPANGAPTRFLRVYSNQLSFGLNYRV